MLTTKEVEQLFQLNRVTIYRLIREENFPAVKVGGQWRFPEEQVKSWLSNHVKDVPPVAARPTETPETAKLFNTTEITALLEAFAHSVNLSVFVVDPVGNVLADCPVCRHPFCQLMQSYAKCDQPCDTNFRRVQTEGGRTPRLLGCASGMKYLQSPVLCDDEEMAYVLMGPILMMDSDEVCSDEIVASFAQHTGIDAESAQQCLQSVQQFSTEQVHILVDLLSQVIGTMVHVVRNRLRMAERVNEMAQLVAGHSV